MLAEVKMVVIVIVVEFRRLATCAHGRCRCAQILRPDNNRLRRPQVVGGLLQIDQFGAAALSPCVLCEMANLSSLAAMLESDNDIFYLMPTFDVVVSRRNLLERISSVNDWFQRSRRS